jgi:hypothetical protein
MKKALMTCLAVTALFAIASSATAITCTLDQRPAATLLVPYFQVSIVPGSGAIVSGGDLARDTIVTIVNASGAPMLAHVNVYNRFSEIKLDFNIALTGYDVQAMRMSDIISGFLPTTLNSNGDDTCQGKTGANAIVYPDPDGFLRVSPTAASPISNPATGQDNDNGTTNYGANSYGSIAQDLATDCSGDAGFLAIGYITIDHANYCNLSDPTDPNYFINDAIGMENNLFGEIIFTSGNGLPTYGISTVNMEVDPRLQGVTNSLAWGTLQWQGGGDPARTFYARYLDIANEALCNNCNSGNSQTDLSVSAPWDQGFGDQREPLGLRWAARWFDLKDVVGSNIITSNFQVWRSSPTTDGFTPAPSNCQQEEPLSTLTFWDEDEFTVTQGVCPSPCTTPQFNFPYETQQKNISKFVHPKGTSLNPAVAGWVQMDFVSVAGDLLDQAWVGYSFEGNIALESVLVGGTQLDPSSCNPLGFVTQAGAPTVQPITPAIDQAGIPGSDVPGPGTGR